MKTTADDNLISFKRRRRMGGKYSMYSEAVPDLGDVGYVAVIIYDNYRLGLIHCPRHVKDTIQATVVQICQSKKLRLEEKGGEACISYDFVIPILEVQRAFYANALKECIVLRLLQEMYRLGYDLIISAKMTSGKGGEKTTLFFKHSGIEDRRDVPLMCVAPYGENVVSLLRYTDAVEKSVKQVVGVCWPRGIQSEGLREIAGEVHKLFILNGRPWSGSCTDDEYIDSRFMFLQFLTNFAVQHWKVRCAVNVGGGHPDIFLFSPGKIHLGPGGAGGGGGSDYDLGMSSGSLAMMSVTRSNVLRLINFDAEIAAVVRATILRYFQVGDDSFLEQHDFSGVTEFDFRGNPFLNYGAENEFVTVCQLICRIFESLRYNGWEVLVSTRFSRRRNTEKSAFIMKRCEPAWLAYGCIAPCEPAAIKLIDFPETLRNQFRDVIVSCYLPGHSYEQTSKMSNCHEVSLNGDPWSSNSRTGLHAKSMMLMILKYAQEFGCEFVTSADIASLQSNQVAREVCAAIPASASTCTSSVQTWFYSFSTAGTNGCATASSSSRGGTGGGGDPNSRGGDSGTHHGGGGTGGGNGHLHMHSMNNSSSSHGCSNNTYSVL